MPHTDTINTLKTTALTVPPLTALAWEFNDAHQEVQKAASRYVDHAIPCFRTRQPGEQRRPSTVS
jgi:hypothetical protein